MVLITRIFTIIGAIIFCVVLFQMASVKTSYGSPALSFPVILGLFVFCFGIPIILWIITALTSNKRGVEYAQNKNITLQDDHNIRDPDVLEQKHKMDAARREEKKLVEKITLLKESYRDKVISKEVYDRKAIVLNQEISEAQNRRINEEKKYSNMFALLPAFLKLEKLHNQGVISYSELREEKRRLLKNR